MRVVSIEGDTDITTLSDSGPLFLRVRVNLEGRHGDSWFILDHDDPLPKIGDEFVVPVGAMPTARRISD